MRSRSLYLGVSVVTSTTEKSYNFRASSTTSSHLLLNSDVRAWLGLDGLAFY